MLKNSKFITLFITYIEQLIQWQMPLSQNQIYIYNHKNLQNKPKSSRITIPSFIPPKKKIEINSIQNISKKKLNLILILSF